MDPNNQTPQTPNIYPGQEPAQPGPYQPGQSVPQPSQFPQQTQPIQQQSPQTSQPIVQPQFQDAQPQVYASQTVQPTSTYQAPFPEPVQIAPASMVSMAKPSNKPSVGLIVLSVVLGLLFIASAVAAVMFYSQLDGYKNKSDQKSAAAVKAAEQKQKTELDKEFEEKYKEPMTTYTSPAQFGAVAITYPKTWSAYVDEGSSSSPVNAYFHPGFVPTDKGGNDSFNYALRAQIIQSTYQKELETYSQGLKKGELTATPVVGLPGNVTATRLDGKIDQNSNGSVVIIPVRDKVLKIWTEGDTYKADFDNRVLKELKFNP